LVLDQIFDYHSPERKVADGFGVKLTSENIADHLAKIRQERQ
jgi:hypothetical protein